MPDAVTYRRTGSCAVITISRPEVRNAIDGPTADALDSAWQEWIHDDDARVMVLTGEGSEAFCAGADLKDLDTLAARIPSEGGPLGFTRRISPKPSIAAIEGWCVAGGLELALSCDLRIASESARFGCTERRFGVPLIDGGTQRLPRVVGLGRALDLILTGRVIDSGEAHRIGLANEVVPDGSTVERALDLGNRIASFPWQTVLADRQSTLEAQGVDLVEGLSREADRGASTVEIGALGAAQFADGSGRHGEGVEGPSG